MEPHLEARCRRVWAEPTNIPNLFCHCLNFQYPGAGAEAPAALLSWYLTELPSLPTCTCWNLNMCRTLWVQFCLLQLDRRFKGGECWTDAATTGGGSISLETGLSWLEAISVQRDVKMRAYTQRQTCVSIVWDQTVIPDDHTSAPTRPAVHL